MDITEKIRLSIDNVIRPLAYSFKFPPYEFEDMVQEGWRCALEALPYFDEARGTLEAFLRRHIKNRFLNMRRDHLERQQPPCLNCPFYDRGGELSSSLCTKYGNKDDCKKWVGWQTRNSSKKALANNSDCNGEPLSRESRDMPSTSKVYMKIIEEKIPIAYRGDYLRFIEGVRLPKAREIELLEIIKEIVREASIN